ncbi:hypothetical protein GCM10009007_14450 [Formosimonas limnophila]|uniref:Cell division protein ZipA n=1 Tax=Formosimonas limnophila TaxID=1384487 RepID=A0A8J3CL52_9BURK|nr:cell division protein ZipA C-terminal FtsZ-binding domain-containing protein [Formosimonas limnophila]GHA74528.1 hypothetical protein GCM10009007_14450 [Formosimonas limnophila]
MSEFELSTLVVLALLLVGLATYSYWQIARAGRRQRAQQAALRVTYDDEVSLHDEHYSEPSLLPLVETEPTARDVEVSVPAASASPLSKAANDYAAVSYVPVHHSITVAAPVSAHPPVVVHTGEPLSNVHYHLADEVSEPLTHKAVDEGVHETVHEVVFHSEPVADTPVDLFEPSTPQAVLNSSEAEYSQKSIDSPESVVHYAPQDFREQASLAVFEPLIRFSTWVQTTYPSAIHALDGVIDLVVPQPKHAQDIEKALYDLSLDTDLPLRLYGRRSGSMDAVPNWQSLEPSVLYSGLRLTLQLANRDEYAQPHLIQDWFLLAQRLAKRLVAQVQAMPDPAALGSYAMYLHDLSKRLSAPLMIQLHKKQGLWPAYEVHQHMTQQGLTLGEHGQYVARADDGRTIYQVGNDLGNPRAQDFFRDQLPTMHAHTLSFCLDVSRVSAEYLPMMRMCHDAQQMALSLDAQWLNGQGEEILSEALLAHAEVHVPAYLAQLEQIGVPAGSVTMRRLLSTRS